MITVLVLGESNLADAVRAVLHPEGFRVIYQREIWEAEALLRGGMVDACVLESDLKSIDAMQRIKEVRHFMSKGTILVYTDERESEWEEEAYLAGASRILKKPVRAPLLKLFLEPSGKSGVSDAGSGGNGRDAGRRPPPQTPARGSVWMLKALRSFSNLLTYSLRTDALLREFLSLLREVLGVNRSAIFLRETRPVFVRGQSNPFEGSLLKPACALGLAPGLLDYFELSLESGIGRFAYRSGRILVHGNDAAHYDEAIQKELEVLGVQVAIPILDRERLIGVAVLDQPVTNGGYSDEELAVMFHLLEHLGLAIKNSWLHDELATGHHRMRDILDHMHSGCLVVGPELEILHANRAARDFFGSREARDRTVAFSDLPQELGSLIFETLKRHQEAEPIRIVPRWNPDRFFRASVIPFSNIGDSGQHAVLTVVEEITDQRRAQQLEIEAARLRLIHSMAGQLAHEIGNSMVPISAFQQAAGTKAIETETLNNLREQSGQSVQRITRLLNQMWFLAQDKPGAPEPIRVRGLLEEAGREALRRAERSTDEGAIRDLCGEDEVTVRGDRYALKHALMEVILNGLEAGQGKGRVTLRCHEVEGEPTAERFCCIEVEDDGEGLSEEVFEKAFEPFFTRRYSGLGLGLTVARKIFELHHGSIRLETRDKEAGTKVTLSLREAFVAEESDGSSGSD